MYLPYLRHPRFFQQLRQFTERSRHHSDDVAVEHWQQFAGYAAVREGYGHAFGEVPADRTGLGMSKAIASANNR
jgi:hypothetical protein